MLIWFLCEMNCSIDAMINLTTYDKEISLIAKTRVDVEVEAYIEARRQQKGESYDNYLAGIVKNGMPLEERVKHEALTGEAREADTQALAEQYIRTLKEKNFSAKKSELEQKYQDMALTKSEE